MNPTTACVLLGASILAAAPPLTLEQVRSYAFPNELVAAATGSRVAWAVNERGLRNIYAAEGPTFEPRKLTNYSQDDGQELTGVTLSRDGAYVVYVRGGDHGSNWERTSPVNPLSSPVVPKVQVWSVPFSGGEPKLLGDGSSPAISPRGDVVAFVRDRAVYTAPLDGSAEGKRLFAARGDCHSPQWSPDGTRLAFVSGRGSHSLIGVYSKDAPILWLAPSTSHDGFPRWSPDGKRIALIRRPGSGGAPEPILEQRPQPWSIWTADAATGEARRVWRSAATLRGSMPTTHGGPNLHWAGSRLAFVSYQDGWPHLYAMPSDVGAPVQLTKGSFMLEHITISPDHSFAVASANTGPDAHDIDRRHILRIPLDKPSAAVLTPGTGLEWTPVVTGDGRSIVFLSATAQRPPAPAVIAASGGAPRLIGSTSALDLVTPKPVRFQSPDGLTVHAQLFEVAGGPARKPAVVYIHGGPMRQMLLGWHYSDYYANAYALNQLLAGKGYVVLSVNYRLGIGYGYEFHHAPKSGTRGASEYLDIRAAGEYLRKLPQVDPKRIGVYGGSYGGYLTAMALARDSGLFAAGVDIHGVHDRTQGFGTDSRYEKPPDYEQARKVAWESSPVAYVSTWTSPVLLIHGDDDRNVRFDQTVDLVRRLEKKGVKFEEIVIPDDTHHFMRWANQNRVDAATADFFDRNLK